MSSRKSRRPNKSDSINTKIIDPLKEGSFVVGPGQLATPLTKMIFNGDKKRNIRKKRKHTDSQSDYQSLDEMLADPNQSLNYGNPDGMINGVGPDVPSTGNLVNTLIQGLQSQNEQMLNTVLDRQDAYIIRETLHNLPNEMVDEFLRRLRKLFFTKGDRLIHYYIWLTTLLQEKMSVILTSRTAQTELASLRQLFATRCDAFDRLCALNGRLSLLSSLVESSAKDSNLMSTINAVHYQESSDEEGAINGQDEDENFSGLSSEDRDLEKIIVMDLSDDDKDSEEEDGDDDDALDSDAGKGDGNMDNEENDNEGDADTDGDDENDNSD